MKVVSFADCHKEVPRKSSMSPPTSQVSIQHHPRRYPTIPERDWVHVGASDGSETSSYRAKSQSPLRKQMLSGNINPDRNQSLMDQDVTVTGESPLSPVLSRSSGSSLGQYGILEPQKRKPPPVPRKPGNLSIRGSSQTPARAIPRGAGMETRQSENLNRSPEAAGTWSQPRGPIAGGARVRYPRGSRFTQDSSSEASFKTDSPPVSIGTKSPELLDSDVDPGMSGWTSLKPS